MKKLILFLLIIAVTSQYSFSADKFVVVIDAGHGGRDPGAVRGKIKEKDINLDVALYLGRLIEDNHSDVKVIYTRKSDVAVDIRERTRIANKAKANLFISIHTNSTKSTSTSAHGADTYTLGIGATDENLEAARRENSAVEYEDNYKQKYKSFSNNSPENNLIIEFTASKYMEQSIDLASYIQDGFRNVAKRKDNGIRQSGFWVLKDNAMPSVLIELGFINNASEARYLTSTIGKRSMANAIYTGFKKYKNNFDKKENGQHIAAISSSNDNKASEVKETVQAQQTKTSSSSKFISKPKQDPVKTSRSTVAAREEQQVVVKNTEQTKTADTKTAIVSKPRTDVKPVVESKPVVVKEESKQEPTIINNKPAAIGTNETEYRVQIFISKEQLPQSSSRFKGLSPVSYYIDGGIYKYTYGSTTSQDEALRIRNQVRTKFSDAFVIELRGGKRIK